ncbi:MAG: MBOAT family O-acyltransferase [Oscillospiraceae bacterium]
MVFSSLTFLYFFLPAVMILYFFAGTKVRNVILLVSGLLFYAWGEPFYIVIMLISTLIDYTAGRLMDKFDSDDKKRRICLLVSVIMNVGLLSVFKYSNFIFDNISALTGQTVTNPFVSVNKCFNGIFPFELNEKRIDLPIGISFFTFQSMSYTIDLYLRKIKVQKSFLSFAAYISMFPQIVAGPIVRYEDVAAEIDNRSVNMSKISIGIAYFIKGLAKKVLLANNIGAVWTEIKALDFGEISVLTAWIGILAFTFQIYFDFSGYSDMAVGLGKMMGFNFPQNFDHPYISKSVSEFWRRWHITLGSWFRSYVYIPLGGNRKGTKRTLLNLLIVWALTGLWHGASWNFVLWGLYFGIIIIIERVGLGKLLEKLPSAVSTVYTFLLVVFGWVLFDTDTLTDAIMFFKAMFGGTGIITDNYSLYMLASNIVMLAICAIGSTSLPDKLYSRLNRKSGAAVSYAMPVIQAAVLLICTAFLTDATYNPFMYFRF